MTGTAMIGLAAGTARLPVFQDTHTRVKETSDLWLGALVGRLGHDLNDGALPDLIGTEDTELDTDDGLHVRASFIKTERHSSLLNVACDV